MGGRIYRNTQEDRELGLQLMDYGDIERLPEARRNVYEVTEEFYTHNGHVD